MTDVARSLVLGMSLLLADAAGAALAQYDTQYDESGWDQRFDQSDFDRQYGKSGLDHDDLDDANQDNSDLDPSGLDRNFNHQGIDDPTYAPPIEPTPGGTDLGTAD